MNQDLTVGKPSTVLRNFCIPLFASVIFQQLYNIADSLVAGRFLGETALAAVGNSYEITLIYLAFSVGCNVACSIILSFYFGSKDFASMKTTVSTSLISCNALCFILVALGFLLGRQLLVWIHTPVDIFDDSLLYLLIYTAGFPFVMFYNIATGIFSAMGDSKTPFYFLVCSSVSNIFMDIFFVSSLSMGISGVAWATFLCQGISCCLSWIFISRRLKALPVQDRPALFSKSIFCRLTKVAIPSILQQGSISIGNIIIQGVINSFGSGVIAGYAASVKLNNMLITALSTLGNGISNYTSQNLGAGKSDRIRAGFKAGIQLVWIICIPVILLYCFCGRLLVSLFLPEPSADALRTGILFLRILSPFYLIVSCKLVADGCLKGAQLMKRFMVSTFTDLILRVVLAVLLSRTVLGSVGIWLSWPIGWIVATYLSVTFYRNGPWSSVSGI